VNLYLFMGPPLTLVDTGPNSGTTLDALERSLADLNLTINDIERVVLTHQHVDHIGLAGVIANRGSAEVLMLNTLTPYLADWQKSAELDDQMAAEAMTRNGLPRATGDAVKQVAKAYRAFGDSVAATTSFAPGDKVEIGGVPFEAHWRPGHSPTDTIFVREDGLMIGGDHLLPEISSNPVLSRDFLTAQNDSQPLRRYRSLPAYLDSMRATHEMDISRVLPGHGPVFEGHAELIDNRLTGHDKRATRMLAALENGPANALQVAHAIWGEIAAAQPFLTFSEVLGHMDVLADEGKVVETPSADGESWLFQLS
jgi:glyoxylase-like metal-dependent hydrolase (beta-lactamase superfamily II)